MISEIDANNIHKTQNIQQETTSITKKLNDETKPVKTEVREMISSQPINNDKEKKTIFLQIQNLKRTPQILSPCIQKGTKNENKCPILTNKF